MHEITFSFHIDTSEALLSQFILLAWKSAAATMEFEYFIYWFVCFFGAWCCVSAVILMHCQDHNMFPNNNGKNFWPVLTFHLQSHRWFLRFWMQVQSMNYKVEFWPMIIVSVCVCTNSRTGHIAHRVHLIDHICAKFGSSWWKNWYKTLELKRK